MLQQTRVDTVVPYYARFLERFPTTLALAEASPDEVLAAWSGLGYYRRARMLHDGARALALSGYAVPSRRRELLSVPGIGPYTAGAIASIAFDEAVGLVDGNVARVLARLFALACDMRKGGMKTAARLADEIVAPDAPGAWNQALMELGATVCTPRNPACHECPVAPMCRARAEHRTNELPVVSAKIKPEVRRVQALVATRRKDGAVLVGKREEGQLFGGLWEPPWVFGDEEARLSLAVRLGFGDPPTLVRLGGFDHLLTHRRLRVDTCAVELPKGYRRPSAPPEGYIALRFVKTADLSALGVSTFAKKVLATAQAGKGALDLRDEPGHP